MGPRAGLDAAAALIDRRVRAERFRLHTPFRTAAFERREVEVLVVELRDGDLIGRGETFVHERSGTTPAAELERARRTPLEALGDPSLQPSPAIDALDAAALDLEAKREGARVWTQLGVPAPEHVETMMTIGIAPLAEMTQAARAAEEFTTLKIKSGPGDALARVRAVRAARPDTQLVVDGNESWSVEDLHRLTPTLADLGVALLEQPLAAGEDAPLATLTLPLRLCADESATHAPIDTLRGRYDAVNVKLPKAGGLRRALRQIEEARALDMAVFVGCMVSTSLAIAPAWIAAAQADFVDLDGPLHLARDREPPMPYQGERIGPPPAALWG